ncbi:MAG: response regulator transcription factor [Desulfobulbaceae bacterium]|jgi:two-component system OmpR family response regulator|nr:response regulator transcription factor [Desulfobulbaceae bacterium]
MTDGTMQNEIREFKVLIVEDDPSIQAMLATYLSANGGEVTVLGDGLTFLSEVRARRPDIILLDVVLPGDDGFALLRRLRGAGVETPVIMLTERGAVDDKVQGLDMGADDYLTKPFSSRELLARIKSRLRRGKTTLQTIQVGDMDINPATREVRCAGGDLLQLTKTEFDLFLHLARKAPQVVGHSELFTEVLGYKSDVETKALVMHIANIRRKLSSMSIQGTPHIQSVAGIGYKLVA